MPSQEEDTLLWANGVRGEKQQHKREIDISINLNQVWESLAPHLCLVGLLALMIWKDHRSLWDFLRPIGKSPNCSYISPFSSFYLNRLFLALEMCVADLSIFKVRQGNLLCPLNNREVSLPHDIKQALFHCVAKTTKWGGPQPVGLWIFVGKDLWTRWKSTRVVAKAEVKSCNWKGN